jgi:hypothetical protein
MSLLISKQHKPGWIEAHRELIKSAKNGYLTIGKMPRAYHGLLRKDLLIKECSPAGKLRGGSPDMSMAISLALNNYKTFIWDKALSIYGASSGSGGGMTTERKHLMELNNVNFLQKEFIDSWNIEIPRYWSEYTVMPATALYIHKIKKTKPQGFNLGAVYAAIIVNENMMIRRIFQTFKLVKFNTKFKLLFQILMNLPRKIIGYSWRKIQFLKNTKMNSYITIYNDIEPIEIMKFYIK